MTNLSTAPKTFCFVLMPFDEKFDDIYQLGIKEACNIAGAYSERVDEQNFHETILDRIYNQISKADIVIADMSGRNPNVFYEVGYAHALGKPTVLLTQDVDDIPFDLKHYPHIVYEKKITRLRDELSSSIQWFIENPQNKETSYKIDLNLYLDSNNLSDGNVVYTCRKKQLPVPKITIHNNSPKTYEPENIRIAIVTSKNIDQCDLAGNKTANTIKLPDGKFMHNIPNSEILFPQAYGSIHFQLMRRPNLPEEYTENIVVRIFTDSGFRNYPLTIKNTK